MISNIAVSAARKLRIKIHDMGEDNQYPECRGSAPANAKWLDTVSAEDAPIIESAIREALLEMAKKIRGMHITPDLREKVYYNTALSDAEGLIREAAREETKG